ncbi:DUF6111 family protein [Amorphus orientalis]|uniref:Uncharacterized protein n=1 Tax=Amorphus orientalis TaxID=649198 RepID=A0AAE3VLD9_9HYPH|nr:DUF6111 family protein [Amorphus orientalis]MDQ0313885.1 hypothetical protein [Amorphus orientalis]
MVRVILVQLILFLLPFIGWAIFLAVTRGLSDARASYFIGPMPYWLAVAGLILSIAGFLALGVVGDQETGVYHPLRFEDGKLVPGGFDDN